MDLCAEYNAYSIRNFSLEISLLTLFALLCVQVYAAGKNRIACLGIALFWLSLLPVSNFIPIYRPMADRFLYLPMCGVALLLAVVGGIAKLRTRAGAVLASAMVCALAVITLRQENVWENTFTLWKDAAERNPVSYTAANNFAETLLNKGENEKALEFAERAIRLTGAREANPFGTIAVAQNNLGRTADADAAFRKAAELDPRYLQPEKLVEALVLSEKEAQRLEVIARRNL